MRVRQQHRMLRRPETCLVNKSVVLSRLSLFIIQFAAAGSRPRQSLGAGSRLGWLDHQSHHHHLQMQALPLNPGSAMRSKCPL